MGHTSVTKTQSIGARIRQLFITRDVMFHDGRDLKRFSVRGRTQAFLAGVATVTVAFSAYGVAQAAGGAISASGVVDAPRTAQSQMAAMRTKVEQMQADIAAAKQAAAAHAARVEQRQAIIQALLSGQADRKALNKPLASVQSPNTAVAAEVLEPLRRIEVRQLAFAAKAQAMGEARVAAAANHLRRLGLRPERYVKPVVAMGGPFEPVDGADAAAATTDSDAQFRTLFQTWKKLDALEQTAISIPSIQPVDSLSFTSNFGVRSDPFRGVAAMHAGVDIPGPMGTPVYATADGIVSHSGRQGGYGNLVEINHGKGIETRYGHLSKILVAENTRVHRGQLIGLMGSTGRSTGSHLHYEVRVDGRAVNPVPFLQTAGYVPMAARPATAVGGPR